MFSFLKKDEEKELSPIFVSDEAIVAMADGCQIDVSKVPDPVFAEKVMGDSIAFTYTDDQVVLCAPANGILTLVFETGHMFSVTTHHGVELLVHIGVDTVKSKGEGFTVLKKEGEPVKAGDPIVRVDMKKLRKKYDMSVMLIITNNAGKEIRFLPSQMVVRGQSVIAV